jgi:hypothetical protein
MRPSILSGANLPARFAPTEAQSLEERKCGIGDAIDARFAESLQVHGLFPIEARPAQERVAATLIIE